MHHFLQVKYSACRECWTEEKYLQRWDFLSFIRSRYFSVWFSILVFWLWLAFLERRGWRGFCCRVQYNEHSLKKRFGGCRTRFFSNFKGQSKMFISCMIAGCLCKIFNDLFISYLSCDVYTTVTRGEWLWNPTDNILCCQFLFLFWPWPCSNHNSLL